MSDFNPHTGGRRPYRNDWHYEDGDEEIPTPLETIGYYAMTALVVFSILAAVFC